jgi:hypothetical protein
MSEQQFYQLRTFGGVVKVIMVALHDRELPPLEERWSQTDRIHGFHLRCGDFAQTLWIRDSELLIFGFHTPEDLDDRLTGEGYEPFIDAVELVGRRYFRAYEKNVTNRPSLGLLASELQVPDRCL